MGVVPGIGDALDVVNGVVYLDRGKWEEAAWSLAVVAAGRRLRVGGDPAFSAVSTRRVGGVMQGAGSDATIARSSGRSADSASGVTPAPRRATARGGGSSSGGGACRVSSFEADTAVLLADGTLRAISDVQAGDLVWARDPATGEAGARRVVASVTSSGDRDLVEVEADGETVTATAGHPFWVDDQGRWVHATHLEAGDRLLAADGTTTDIDAVAHRSDTLTVHNLSIDGIHTYHVNIGDQQVVVHNCAATVTQRALPAGSPGRVVANALEPHELAQAQRIVDFRGGTFVGNAQRGAPGIDGTLDGVSASLKSYSGSSPSGVLRHASRAEVSAANAGYRGVEVFIDAGNVSRSSIVGNRGLAAIPTQGTVSSIYVRTADGWVVFPG